MRMLVTGGSGFLGSRLCARLVAAGHDVSATAFRNPLPAGVRAIELDLEDRLQIGRALVDERFDCAIHAAAQIRIDVCERDRDHARALNVEATAALCEALAAGTHFVYVSSDLVFDGRRGHYREDDAPRPCMVYGETKRLSEEIVRGSALPWAVARVALMFGTATPHHGSFVDWLDSGLRGDGLSLFSDEYRSAVFVDDAARGLVAVCEQRARGTFHLGGPERLSRADFGEVYAGVFGLDPAKIVRRRQAELPQDVPRPADVSLCIDKARLELGYAPRATRAALTALREQRAAAARSTTRDQ